MASIVAEERGRFWPVWFLVVWMASGPLIALFFAHEGRAVPRVHGGQRYLSLLAFEAALVLFVCLSARLPGGVQAARLLGDWSGGWPLLWDVALALVGCAAVFGWEALWPHRTPSALLPADLNELWLWIPTALAVAFTEELTFRGYLQQQFIVMGAPIGLAIAAQAGLFALLHGEQGLPGVVKAAIYGVIFGGMARGRRSLRPSFLCHAIVNLASGLLWIRA